MPKKEDVSDEKKKWSRGTKMRRLNTRRWC